MKKGKKFIVWLVEMLDSIFKFNIHHDFTELFLIKEGRELLGKGYRNFLYLNIMLIITFLAIGFSNGSLKYLEKQMKDPFVRFVDLDIPISKSDQINTMLYELNHDTLLQKRYLFENVIGYNGEFLSLAKRDGSGEMGTKNCIGRTIDIEDPLLDKIFKEYQVLGRPFNREFDMGVIVTEKLLDKFDLDTSVCFLPFSFPVDTERHIDTIVPLPVIAVVEELPGLFEFAVTPYFYSQRNNYRSSPFNPAFTKKLIYFTDEDSSNTVKIKSIIENYFKREDRLSYIDSPDLSIDLFENNDTHKKGSNIMVSFTRWNKPGDSLLMVMSNEIYNAIKSKNYSVYRIYSLKTDANQFVKDHDYITINFTKLDSIEVFKDYFLKNYELQIDVARVETLKNYRLITRLTIFLSSALILFSVLSICMFVSNILSKHLDKIHMNIGTFKAFGIDNFTLQKIYILMIYGFIFVSILLSFLLSWIFNFSEYFEIIDVRTLITVIAIIAISFIWLNFIAGNILRKSPGDLIYSRL